MEKLHSLRIVHRDLKLANILVNKDFQVLLYIIYLILYKFITPNYFFKKKFYRSS
jgi:serine/threonine protein kinase